MKLDSKTIFSVIFGLLIAFIIMSHKNSDMSLIKKVNATSVKSEVIDGNSLTSCEVFFKDDRDSFEEEINSRLKNAKLLQSNVLWSETTKQIGFYALICY